VIAQHDPGGLAYMAGDDWVAFIMANPEEKAEG
jgi:hypothetical protein